MQLTLSDHFTDEEFKQQLLNILEPIEDAELAQALADCVTWSILDRPPGIETFLQRWPDLICPQCNRLHRSIKCDEEYLGWRGGGDDD